MPRTIDSILASHNAATERRKAGKPIWDYTLRIKHLISTSDESDDLPLAKKGEIIAKQIKSSSWYKNANADMRYELDDLMIYLDGCDDLDEFNYQLDELYNLCDRCRVWVA